MSMEQRRLLQAGLLSAWLALGAGAAAADETTFCNVYITSAGYTIRSQGHYCLDRNLSHAATAITIDSDFVVLDLNGFKIEALGTLTPFAGIEVACCIPPHRNITIRNGTIVGFFHGVTTNGGGGNLLIEDLHVRKSKHRGISVQMDDNITIRRNIIADTGGSGSSCSSCVFGFGITAYAHAPGGRAVVRDNIIANTFGTFDAIYGNAGAIGISVGEGSIVEGNVVAGLHPIGSGPGQGIVGPDPPAAPLVCRDNTVLGASSAADALVNCTLVGDNHAGVR
jgi:hypothetical protein